MNIIDERNNILRQISSLSASKPEPGSYKYDRMTSLKYYLETLREPTEEEIKNYENKTHTFVLFDKKTNCIMGIYDDCYEAYNLEQLMNIKDVEIQIKELELSPYTNEQMESLVFLKERKQEKKSFGEEYKYRFIVIYTKRNQLLKLNLFTH